MSSLHAGAASAVINPQIGDDLAGQYERRICAGIRDDLEVNVLHLAGADGRNRTLLVSVDLIGLIAAWTTELATAIAEATGVPAEAVLLCCTHTHAGPITNERAWIDVPPNPAHDALLRGSLIAAAQRAVAATRPARAAWARGHAAIGYNRRLCWADGRHTMYGDPRRGDFAGVEGPDDAEHSLLALFDTDGAPLALVHGNACHATCVEASLLASADFPGEARRLLRAELGAALPVLYLQGACGDLAPVDLWSPPVNPEDRLRVTGARLAQETLRLLGTLRPETVAAPQHQRTLLRVGVDLPHPEMLAATARTVAAGEAAVGRTAAVDADSLQRLWQEFHRDPREDLAVHALRVGAWALISNPCELYCQFGLDIKRRSPAAVTAIAELTNGSAGYCPTPAARLGGGYSAELLYWRRLELLAGDRLVEASAQLLHALWRTPERAYAH